MAEVLIPVTRTSRDGEELDDAVADAGDGCFIWQNDGNVTIEVTATQDGMLTVHKGASVAGATFEPDEKDVASGKSVWFGPYPPAMYNRADGSVLIELTAGLSVRGQRI